MKLFTREVKIAITAIVAVVCVFVMINFLKGVNIFESSNTYYVKLKDCAGLQTSNSVYANGYPVGVVRDLDYNYSTNGGVVATIELDQEMSLPEGTVAELESSLMGGVKMVLKLGDNPLRHLAPHDTLVGGPQQGLMDAAGAMIPQIQQMLPKLDSILSNLAQLSSDPALAASLTNLRTITDNLAATSATLPATMQQVNGMATHFNSVSSKLDKVDLEGTMASVNATLTEAQSLIDHFDQTAQTLDTKLKSKDNSLGLLLNDTGLYTNINHTIQSADTLLTDLKQHPKRYVHFSVFGKKDK